MIKIDDKYFIDATANCYVLKERTTVQNEESENYGKEVYSDLGYYVSLETLLKGLLKYEIRQFISESKEKSLNSLLKYIKEQDERIKNFKLDI